MTPAEPSSALDQRRGATGLSRQRQLVFERICAGRTNAQTAQELGLAVSTAANHAKAVLKHFGVSTRAALITLAYDRGLLGTADRERERWIVQRSGPFFRTARCRRCTWAHKEPTNVDEQAATHTIDTGHDVAVTTTIVLSRTSLEAKIVHHNALSLGDGMMTGE